MASSEDDKGGTVPPLNDEEALKIESGQLLEDLNGRLDKLREGTELCNRIMRDLVDLRGVLAAKKLSDATIPTP